MSESTRLKGEAFWRRRPKSLPTAQQKRRARARTKRLSSDVSLVGGLYAWGLRYRILCRRGVARRGRACLPANEALPVDPVIFESLVDKSASSIGAPIGAAGQRLEEGGSLKIQNKKPARQPISWFGPALRVPRGSATCFAQEGAADGNASYLTQRRAMQLRRSTPRRTKVREPMSRAVGGKQPFSTHWLAMRGLPRMRCASAGYIARRALRPSISDARGIPAGSSSWVRELRCYE